VVKWERLDDRSLHSCWDEIKDKVVVTMKRFEKSVRKEWGEGETGEKSVGIISGVPLSVSPDTPGPALSDHLEKEAKRRKLAFIRAKDARGELPDRFLSAQVKQEEEERTIRTIRAADGSLTVTQQEISNTMTTHFRNLYSARPTNHNLQPHCIVLPSEVTQALGQALTVQVQEGKDIALKKSSSAPGPDGLPYQVYTAVPGFMKLLLRVCQWATVSGEVPPSWDTAYIRCLLKRGKDKLLPESYRPISLTCTDCKIFTGILAARLQKFGDTIFGPEQTGYLRGRNTAMAAIRVADFFARHRSFLPVLLDYKKAYDHRLSCSQVDHGWIGLCLAKSGMGKPLRGVLMALLWGMRSRLIINGELGDWFHNASGVRDRRTFLVLSVLRSKFRILIPGAKDSTG